jgi:hypothetical protein
MKKAQEKIILGYVRKAQAKGVTGVKNEFEAVFGRIRNDYPTYEESREPSYDCTFCEEGTILCEFCESGRISCGFCDGGGEIRGFNDDYATCPRCDGDGWHECDECSGEEGETCTNCNGDWENANMPEVEAWRLRHGRQTPEAESVRAWHDEAVCHDFLLEHLSQYGLAEKDENLTDDEKHLWRVKEWRPKYPLTFSRVYHDQTVDTEWTHTLALPKEHPEYIFLMEKCREAWVALGEAIGNGIGIDNAGMHMSLLFAPDASYPMRFQTIEQEAEFGNKFHNFRKSMVLLMPALYFLGASRENTRPFSYRVPQASTSKYSAIHYIDGALEFRVFDTCYDTPDQILHNFAVMVKCLKFWSTKYVRNYLDTVTKGKRMRFGTRDGGKLTDLYITIEHIELLNRGLELIKPDYLTISELKKQRGFDVNKRKLTSKEKEYRLQAAQEYLTYEKRFGWEAVMNEHSLIIREIQRHMESGDIPQPGDADFLDRVKERVNQYMADYQASKKSLEVFTDETLNRTLLSDYDLTTERY